MLPFPPLPVLFACCLPPAPPEPDGSRTLGIVPPYRAEPAPPCWLRSTSHQLASGAARNARHYIYEAYADGEGGWLVRYIQYPDALEAAAKTQLAFLFRSDPQGDPLGEPWTLRPAEIQFEFRHARWRGRGFLLVDRRDLIRP
jgi:hypothetical protein